METLPGFLAHAPAWLQALGLCLFAVPGLATLFSRSVALGAYFKSRAEARATDSATLSEGWGRLSSAKDQEISRLQGVVSELQRQIGELQQQIAHQQGDLLRGWNLARGTYEALRDLWHKTVTANLGVALRLGQLRAALDLQDPVPELRRILTQWPDPADPPLPPPLDDIEERKPEDFHYPAKGKP